MTLQIMMQPTPNPNAMKFIVSMDLIADGKATFNDPDEAKEIPLANRLLNLANVTQAHFFENVMTVTQNGVSDWGILEKSVEKILREELPRHNPSFSGPESKVKNRKLSMENLPEEIIKIEEILQRTIRPGLQADGGDVEVVDYKDNILSIRYEGACGSCPSAMYGTLEAIRSIMKSEFDPNVEVVAI